MRSTTKSSRMRASGSMRSSTPAISHPAESSDEASPTSPPMMSLVPDSDTFSLVSAAGPPHLDSQASLTTPTSGPVRAPVSRSAPRARGAEHATLDIFGQHGSHSSSSVALQSSLESRLRAETDSRGSTLFTLTWNDAVTPSGRRICALRASARRIFDSDSSSWPTPTRQDAASSGSAGYAETKTHHVGVTLTDAARMASATTPRAEDGSKGTRSDAGAEIERRRTQAGIDLPTTAKLSGWRTPTSLTPSTETNREAGDSCNLRAMRLLVSGLTVNGSTAPTESRGQLNPAHSRWLMGYPVEWDVCADTATQSSRKSRRRSSGQR